jgi:hypothetical protein
VRMTMEWLKKKLERKATKRILVLIIASILGGLGFSDEITKLVANEGAEIIIEHVDVGSGGNE